MILALILSVFIFQNKIVERISPSINYNKLVLYNYVIQNTNKSSNFLIKKGMLDFERKTNRKSLFHNKFVPSQSLKMMEWYENRLLYQEAFDQFKYDSKIDFLITDQKI